MENFTPNETITIIGAIILGIVILCKITEMILINDKS